MPKIIVIMILLFSTGCTPSNFQNTANTARDMEGAANTNVISIVADRETEPVKSEEDAADDPAIWIDYENPANSFIIGTDKKAGLYVYNLNGQIVDFGSYGNENNVDLRQNLTGEAFGGYDTLIASSNRTTNSVDIITLRAGGKLEFLGSYSTKVEPYGLCVGLPNDRYAFRVLLNYKDGLVEITDVTFENGQMKAERQYELRINGQLEGCAFDDSAQEMFIGQEDGGVWRYPMTNPVGKGELQAPLGPETGLVGDLEGMDIYVTPENRKILVTSSQGDFTYVAFEIFPDRLHPLKKFRITDNTANNIDGAQETDGLAVTNVALNPDFPKGILIVQDGENEGGFQNFKIVDWQRVEAILN